LHIHARNIELGHFETKAEAMAARAKAEKEHGKPRRVREWTQEDLDTLHSMRDAGATFTAIAGKLGRHPETCRAQHARNCPVLPPKNGRWTKADLTYLEKHSTMPSADIAEALNRTTAAVISKRASLGLQPPSRKILCQFPLSLVPPKALCRQKSMKGRDFCEQHAQLMEIV
jgi:hypothetical protein